MNSLLQGADPNNDSYQSLAMSLAQSETENGEDLPNRATGRFNGDFEMLISETAPTGAPEISNAVTSGAKTLDQGSALPLFK